MDRGHQRSALGGEWANTTFVIPSAVEGSLTLSVRDVSTALDFLEELFMVAIRAAKDERSIEESLYLLSIPGMRQSIRKGMQEALEKCSVRPGWRASCPRDSLPSRAKSKGL